MTSPKGPLGRLFEPRSVAVVGASANPDKAGAKLFETLTAFDGPLYPINPTADRILDRKAYPSIAAVPEAVDLVFLALPAPACAAALREAAAAGASAAVIVSGGFGETDGGGRALQDEIADIRRSSRLRILGPNTSGFLNPPRRLFGTFLPEVTAIGPGAIGLAAQSGGVNISLAFAAHEAGLGVALAAGLGNAVDVNAADVIEYLAAREDVRAIAVHLEGVVAGRRLFEAVGRAAAAKPVVALPVGRTDIAAFARSHTGNLMGSHALTRAALAQAGAVVVGTTTDLLDAAHALSRARLAPKARPGAAVLTAQAGPGLIIADYLNGAGVDIPSLSPAARERVGELLPPMTYLDNPVDTGRPAETFPGVLAAVASDPAIDAVLAYAIYEPGTVDPAAVLAEARETTGKPIVHATAGRPDVIADIAGALEAAGVPCYTAADRAAVGLRALVDDAKARHRLAAAGEGQTCETRVGDGPLDEAAAKDVLDALGVATPRRAVCADRAAAARALADLGGPVAAKLLDPAVRHKTEAGAVHLGIETEDQLAAALDRIDRAGPKAGAARYLIEAMAPPGVELIVGGMNDPSYGATVLVGLGGTAAEALGDTALRLAPLSPAEARAMLDELRGHALLDGWRGMPAVDKAALAEAIVKVGALLAANPHVSEIDLNPVRAYPDGILALDALIVCG